MAKTLADITVTADDWVSLNTLTGFPVGTYMTVTNKSSREVVLFEDSVKPVADSVDGIILTPLVGKEPSGIVPDSSLEIWAKGLGGDAVLSVQHSSIVTSDVVPVEVSNRGSRGVPMFILDQTTPPLSIPLLKSRTLTTLSANANKGDTVVNLTAGHNAEVGDILELASATVENVFIQTAVTSLNVNALTIDQPLNVDYLTSDIAQISTRNMLANASLATPEIFTILPLPTQQGDIVRLTLDLRGSTDMDFGTFGSDDALANGCVVRIKQSDGNFRNLFNFKTNGDFIRQCFDHNFLLPRAVGNTIKGFTARLTWGGQSKHGVVIRLNGALDEELQVLVQDDLVTGSSNTVFAMTAQGHEIQG
jgi:hypothetical protein